MATIIRKVCSRFVFVGCIHYICDSLRVALVVDFSFLLPQFLERGGDLQMIFAILWT